MYKKHKIKLLITLILTMLLSYIFNFKILDLSLELMLFDLTLLIIYILFLTNLTQDKELCERLKYSEDEEINSKSKLGVILNYFRVGIRICILSIVSLIFFKQLQIFNLYLLFANLSIFKCLISFIINKQIYR